MKHLNINILFSRWPKLNGWKNQILWKICPTRMLQDTKIHFENKGKDFQMYCMASQVLLFTLGRNWWKDNCAVISESTDPFLIFNENSQEELNLERDRIIKLGHMVYGLKNQEGYKVFINSLKRGDLESDYFELRTANMLHEDGYNVRFVKETGVKTADYDLHCKIIDEEFCVEAKSRRDGIILSEKTLTNTLKKAKGQLPKSMPCVIFVSIPYQWIQDAEAESIIESCIKNFLNNTKRINFVIVAMHSLHNLEDGKIASVQYYLEYKNESPRIRLKINNLLKSIQPSADNVLKPNFEPSFWKE